MRGNAVLDFECLSRTHASSRLTCPERSLAGQAPLSWDQSRRVDVHEQAWCDRLTSPTLRVAQPMRSPPTRAHPAHVSVFLLSPPTPAQEFGHLDANQTRRRSPPVGLTTDRGRGSKPRGGTAAWTLPRRRRAPHGLREGGLLPLASTGGESRPPPPLAPRISHHTSTEVRRLGAASNLSGGARRRLGCSSEEASHLLLTGK